MASATGAIELQGAVTRIRVDLATLRKDLARAKQEYSKFQNEVGKNKQGVDKVKGSLDGLAKTVKSFSGTGTKGMSQFSGATTGAASGLAALIPMIATASTAVIAFAAALGGVAVVLGGLTFAGVALWNLAKNSEEVENSMTATLVTAKRFGYDIDQVAKAIRIADSQFTEFSRGSIAEFIGITSKAQIPLSDMLDTLSLFRDNIAQFSNLNPDEALQKLTYAISTQQSELLDMIGVNETWEQLQQRGETSLKSQGKAYNELTARVEGLKMAMSDTKGLRGALGDTIGQELAKANKALDNAKLALGEAFKPVYLNFLKLLVPLIQQLSKWLMSIDWTIVANGVQLFISYLIKGAQAVIKFLANLPLIGTFIKGVQKLFEKAKKPADQMGDALSNAVEKAKKVPNGTVAKQIGDEAKQAQEKLADLAKQLQDEAYSFNKSLAQIIDSRAKNLADAQKDLTEETTKFQESQENMLKSYQDNVQDMVKEHNKRVSDMIADRKREVDDFEKSERKKRREFEETQEEQKQENSKKLRDLKRQLEKELSAGGNYNAGTVEQLKKAIQEQEDLLNAQLNKARERFEEEMAEDKESHEQKLSEIDQRIAEENERYDKQLEDAKIRYEEDYLALKESYEKRREELQITIDEERAFLEKHAEDAKLINRNMLLDEVEELKKNHAERTAEIAKNMNEQESIVSTGMAGMTSDMLSSLGDWDFKIEETATNFDEQLNKMIDEAKPKVKKFLEDVAGDFDLFDLLFGKQIGKLKDKWNGFLDFMKFMANPVPSMIMWAFDSGLFTKLGDKFREMWDNLKNVATSAWDSFTSFGGRIKDSVFNTVNALIDRIEGKLKGISIPIPFADDIKPFQWIYIPRFYKDGGKPQGGSPNGTYVNFMNENGKKEGIQLPSGSMIYSYEDTKSIVNELKNKIRSMRSEIPAQLGKVFNPNPNLQLDMNGMGGGKGDFNQNNYNTINYPVDIKTLARELMFEAKSKGYL